MRVRFTANTSVRGIPVTAGQVLDVPDGDLWRLTGKCEPVQEQAAPPNELPPEVVESRDPDPEHRDPQSKRKPRA